MPKRQSYTVEFKLSAIEWHRENGDNVSKTSKEFGVDRKMIRNWLANEGELRAHNRGEGKKKRKLSSGGELACEEMDLAVLEFLVEERANGRVVSNLDLKRKALEIARDFRNMDEFKASDGWLRRWKKRNRVAILMGTNESQKIPADYGEQISEFLSSIKAKRRMEDYTLYNIGKIIHNIFLKLLPNIQYYNVIFSYNRQYGPDHVSI
jgi:transposase-like protein